MMTFLAPASTWAWALVASVKKPVDSTTTSTPRSPHLRLAGSRSAKAVMVWSPTLIEVSSLDTSASRRPRIVSYLSRWASEALSVRSLTPTISMSAPDARTARKKLRPMRPKPLIPTRTVTAVLLRERACAGSGGTTARRRVVGVCGDPIARRVRGLSAYVRVTGRAAAFAPTRGSRGPTTRASTSDSRRPTTRRPASDSGGGRPAAPVGVRLPRRASRASGTPRCRGCRAPRRACRPWPAGGGCGRRWRPW